MPKSRLNQTRAICNYNWTNETGFFFVLMFRFAILYFIACPIVFCEHFECIEWGWRVVSTKHARELIVLLSTWCWTVIRIVLCPWSVWLSAVFDLAPTGLVVTLSIFIRSPRPSSEHRHFRFCILLFFVWGIFFSKFKSGQLPVAGLVLIYFPFDWILTNQN